MIAVGTQIPGNNRKKLPYYWKMKAVDEAVHFCRRIAQEIKDESKGRFCRDCVYLSSSSCVRPTFVGEYSIMVYTNTAIACKQFEAREDVFRTKVKKI